MREQINNMNLIQFQKMLEKGLKTINCNKKRQKKTEITNTH